MIALIGSEGGWAEEEIATASFPVWSDLDFRPLPAVFYVRFIRDEVALLGQRLDVLNCSRAGGFRKCLLDGRRQRIETYLFFNLHDISICIDQDFSTVSINYKGGFVKSLAVLNFFGEAGDRCSLTFPCHRLLNNRWELVSIDLFLLPWN